MNTWARYVSAVWPSTNFRSCLLFKCFRNCLCSREYLNRSNCFRVFSFHLLFFLFLCKRLPLCFNANQRELIRRTLCKVQWRSKYGRLDCPFQILMRKWVSLNLQSYWHYPFNLRTLFSCGRRGQINTICWKKQKSSNRSVTYIIYSCVIRIKRVFQCRSHRCYFVMLSHLSMNWGDLSLSTVRMKQITS